METPSTGPDTLPAAAGSSPPSSPTRGRRGLLALVAIVGVLCVALALSPGARMAVLTAFLLPDLFNTPGPRPLVLVSGAPTRVELRIGSADADLYMPAGGGRHGGLVVTAGVHPLDKRDPVLVRLADGLSRVGLYVLLVQSDALMADRFEPEEPRNLVLAYQRLAAEPGVDARHIGMLGFSAGASLAFLAATDPAIRDEVRELVWLGGYYDANELADEIEAHRYGDTAWEPHPLTQMVFEKNLSNGRAALAALSPKSRVGDFHSRAWVLVDRADPLVPYVHSRELAAALPPAHLAGYVEFQIFEHVQPTKALPPATFVTELWKLTTTVWRVLVPLDPSN